MVILGHVVLFLASAFVIWFFAGLLVESIDRVAKRFNQTGFTVAFFVLGFLTSISEISVMVNATINKTPQISAGNLSGASLVVLLGIVPLLAVVGKGISITHTITRKEMAWALAGIALPTLFLLDGEVTVREGVMCLLAYGTLLYFIRKYNNRHSVGRVLTEVGEELTPGPRATVHDIIRIVGGAIFIFIAGHFLVEETAFFSVALGVPSSILGLLLLSIGTNVPELTIAVRSVLKKRVDIAFGDYLGSALTNTLIFGFLAIVNGRFLIAESNQFFYTAVLMLFGFTGFYKFAVSSRKLSRKEGWLLLCLYGIFIVIETAKIIQLSLR